MFVIGKIKFVINLSKRGARDAHPRGGPNSLNFVQFFRKFDKILCWRPLESWHPHLEEILDPPLLSIGVVKSFITK